MSINRLVVLFFLLMASAWAALVNGQPFFMGDTSAYVRGPDFAVVYLFGNKFATSWTQERTLQGAEHPPQHATAEAPAEDVTLNSPYDKAVLAGRSIYYGALLYIGHLTSHFWLSVFAQAIIFLYLCYTLTIKCLRLSFSTFVCVTSAILVASPVSFFISFLMPDVFASFLILATIIVVGFWNALKGRDRILASAIILYSALTHTSHLLLLICLGSLFACVCFFTERKGTRSILKRVIVLFTLILAGSLGELAFSWETRNTIGSDPIRAPFVMARLIADGPGYQFLQKNCPTKSYVVCKYIDRLPTPSDAFLWSRDPKEGVFSIADFATRQALSSEQTSFVLNVFRSDPIGVITNVASDFFHQLIKVGLDEFFPNQQQLQAFKEKLPKYYLDGLLRSHISMNDWILAPANMWFSFIYIISITALVLAWGLLPLAQFRNRLNFFPDRQWFQVLTIAITGIAFNAAICGALSGPNPRYQARISWIPLFVLLLFVAKLWEALWSSKNRLEFAHRLTERPLRPLRFFGVGGGH